MTLEKLPRFGGQNTWNYWYGLKRVKKQKQRQTNKNNTTLARNLIIVSSVIWRTTRSIHSRPERRAVPGTMYSQQPHSRSESKAKGTLVSYVCTLGALTHPARQCRRDEISCLDSASCSGAQDPRSRITPAATQEKHAAVYKTTNKHQQTQETRPRINYKRHHSTTK